MGKKNQVKIMYRRTIVSLGLLVWGFILLFFIVKGTSVGIIFSSFFIILSSILFLTSLREILKYREKGEVKNRMDERAEINGLKASRKAFEFFIFSMSILIFLEGFEIINEAWFVTSTYLVFGIGLWIYILSWYIYEKRG